MIHEFPLTPYPRTLWVVIGKEKVDDKFDGAEEMDECSAAHVDDVVRKEDERGGYMVRFASKKEMTFNHIVHESTHVGICCFDYIGGNIDYANQECFAYFVGYVADCINQVKRMKNV